MLYAKNIDGNVHYFGGAINYVDSSPYAFFYNSVRVGFIHKFDANNYTCFYISKGFNDATLGLSDFDNSFKNYRFSSGSDPTFTDNKTDFLISNVTLNVAAVKSLSYLNHS